MYGKGVSTFFCFLSVGSFCHAIKKPLKYDYRIGVEFVVLSRLLPSFKTRSFNPLQPNPHSPLTIPYLRQFNTFQTKRTLFRSSWHSSGLA